jgi:hypothetical protein
VKQVSTFFAVTALLGWLPALLSILAVQFALAHGAREWSDFTFSAVFVALYLALVGAGSYLYSRWFN